MEPYSRIGGIMSNIQTARPSLPTTLFVGLDVHKEKIAVAIADEGRQADVRYYGAIDHTPDAVAKLLKKLNVKSQVLRVCYEAGPCGYGIYRQIRGLGHDCEVVAPSMIPKASGDRIKTDQRDALMLAKLHRAGELTPVWVPDEAHEAMRDLVRSRGAAAAQSLRARTQLQAFLLRHDRIYRDTVRAWTQAHFRWLSRQKFDQRAHQIVFQSYVNAVLAARERVQTAEQQIMELLPEWSMKPTLDALCALKGINAIVAATILVATGDMSRFDSPARLMSYFGLVPSERSSGQSVRRGNITKTGNTEVRRVLIQAAWSYRWPARVTPHGLPSFAGVSSAAREIAWKAQLRLTKRFRRLQVLGKPVPVVVTAIARELLGFVWAIGQVARPATM